MAWVNRGLIFKPEPPWTHGMLPVVRIWSDACQVMFSSRLEGKSHIRMLHLSILNGKSLAPSEASVLKPANGFMRDGVSPLWQIDDSLYVMGWRKNKKWGVQEATGILNLKTGEIIAPKVKSGYQVNVITCVVDYGEGLREVYFDGADRFVSPTERYYSVKQQLFYGDEPLTEVQAIFPQIGNESRTSCFRALGNEGWFCAADGDSRIYHIWEAKRVNGKWERVGQIDLETQDWCNESQCYPFPVRHKDGTTYLFFSGNDYGRSGFGYAKLEE